ncbi:MAG: transporter substrate-binding domain-containing protein [Selenomonadaceae bacterium]|nr:transporter substrate-binding domain-containing protein [Selenomonadaceae bacterium]
MKKVFFAALMMVSLLLTGCGSDKPAEAPKAPEKATIGVITHLNASEEKYNDVMSKLEKSYRPSKASLTANYKYHDTLKDMVLALDAGKVDMISTYQCVADYLLRENDKLEIHKGERVLSDNFCLAVRDGDTILLNELNKAIKSMFSDGKLAELSKAYIIDVKDNSELKPVTIENIPDAETIKIAVTGDLPPLDLVLTDGTPSGFSTAVLAEISKRIGKNVELVQIDSAARAAALTSKQVDVVFWVSIPKDNTLIPVDLDKPVGIAISEPYYTDSIVHVALKK